MMDTHQMESTKHQIPISKQAPSSNFQAPNRLGLVWCLELGNWNLFGIWDLEFGA